MVRRFFLGFLGDYHVFAFFWNGRKYGVIPTILSHRMINGILLILLP